MSERADIAPKTERLLRTAEELTLVTRGRRTGREHAVVVWFAYEPGLVWLRTDLRRGSPPDWYRNLLRDPRCRLELAGENIDGVMEQIEDGEDALKHAVRLLREKYGAEWISDWYVDFGRQPVKILVPAPPESARR